MRLLWNFGQNSTNFNWNVFKQNLISPKVCSLKLFVEEEIVPSEAENKQEVVIKFQNASKSDVVLDQTCDIADICKVDDINNFSEGRG